MPTGTGPGVSPDGEGPCNRPKDSHPSTQGDTANSDGQGNKTNGEEKGTSGEDGDRKRNREDDAGPEAVRQKVDGDDSSANNNNNTKGHSMNPMGHAPPGASFPAPHMGMGMGMSMAGGMIPGMSNGGAFVPPGMPNTPNPFHQYGRDPQANGGHVTGGGGGQAPTSSASGAPLPHPASIPSQPRQQGGMDANNMQALSLNRQAFLAMQAGSPFQPFVPAFPTQDFNMAGRFGAQAVAGSTPVAGTDEATNNNPPHQQHQQHQGHQGQGEVAGAMNFATGAPVMMPHGNFPGFAMGFPGMHGPMMGAHHFPHPVQQMMFAQQQRAAASGMMVPPGGFRPPFLMSGAGRLNNDARGFSSLQPSNPSLSLSLACDDEHLSEYQILVRKQLDIFEAGPEDVESNTQGRKKQVSLGQVGIRCRHCAHLPLRQRGRGAVYYPAKLTGVYQAAQNMASSHLCESCQCVDTSLKQELKALRERRDTASGGKQYWADGARAIGMYEADDGCLRMKNDDGETGSSSKGNGNTTQSEGGISVTSMASVSKGADVEIGDPSDGHQARKNEEGTEGDNTHTEESASAKEENKQQEDTPAFV